MKAIDVSCVVCGEKLRSVRSSCGRCGGALAPVSQDAPVMPPGIRGGLYHHRLAVPLMCELGLDKVDQAEWSRHIGDYLVNIQATGDGTWWLTVVCGQDNPALEYSGNLGGCVMQYAAVVTAIQSGLFGGVR